MQREVKVRESRGWIDLGPELRHELVTRDGTLPVEQQQREELLRLVRAPTPVADARAAGTKLERAEHERLDALGDRCRDRVFRRQCRGLQQHCERARVVGVELELSKTEPERVRERRAQQEEVPVPLGGYRAERASGRCRIVLEGYREERRFCFEVARADCVS